MDFNESFLNDTLSEFSLDTLSNFVIDNHDDPSTFSSFLISSIPINRLKTQDILEQMISLNNIKNNLFDECSTQLLLRPGSLKICLDLLETLDITNEHEKELSFSIFSYIHKFSHSKKAQSNIVQLILSSTIDQLLGLINKYPNHSHCLSRIIIEFKSRLEISRFYKILYREESLCLPQISLRYLNQKNIFSSNNMIKGFYIGLEYFNHSLDNEFLQSFLTSLLPFFNIENLSFDPNNSWVKVYYKVLKNSFSLYLHPEFQHLLFSSKLISFLLNYLSFISSQKLLIDKSNIKNSYIPKLTSIVSTSIWQILEQISEQFPSYNELFNSIFQKTSVLLWHLEDIFSREYDDIFLNTLKIIYVLYKKGNVLIDERIIFKIIHHFCHLSDYDKQMSKSNPTLFFMNAFGQYEKPTCSRHICLKIFKLMCIKNLQNALDLWKVNNNSEVDEVQIRFLSIIPSFLNINDFDFLSFLELIKHPDKEFSILDSYSRDIAFANYSNILSDENKNLLIKHATNLLIEQSEDETEQDSLAITVATNIISGLLKFNFVVDKIIGKLLINSAVSSIDCTALFSIQILIKTQPRIFSNITEQVKYFLFRQMQIFIDRYDLLSADFIVNEIKLFTFLIDNSLDALSANSILPLVIEIIKKIGYNSLFFENNQYPLFVASIISKATDIFNIQQLLDINFSLFYFHEYFYFFQICFPFLTLLKVRFDNFHLIPKALYYYEQLIDILRDYQKEKIQLNWNCFSLICTTISRFILTKTLTSNAALDLSLFILLFDDKSPINNLAIFEIYASLGLIFPQYLKQANSILKNLYEEGIILRDDIRILAIQILFLFDPENGPILPLTLNKQPKNQKFISEYGNGYLFFPIPLPNSPQFSITSKNIPEFVKFQQ